jgi:iojap-like protein
MSNIQDAVKLAVKTLFDKKAKEIEVIKVDNVTVIADYFIICTGSSSTQIKALSDEVEFQLKKIGLEPLHREGYASASWVLLDFGSIIVHVFYKDMREYYKLERLWADGEKIPLSEFIDKELLEDEI